MTTTRQRNNVVAGLHSTRTPTWTRSRLGHHSFPTGLSWNLAWHARSVHRMYLQAHNKHKQDDRQYYDIYPIYSTMQLYIQHAVTMLNWYSFSRLDYQVWPTNIIWPKHTRDPYDDHHPTISWPVILTAITTRPTHGQLNTMTSLPSLVQFSVHIY